MSIQNLSDHERETWSRASRLEPGLKGIEQAPPRRPVNGHHPDCPYGATGSDPQTCTVCQGIRKGSPEGQA